MKWFKSQRQEAVSPGAFTASLLKITCDVVKDASQTLEKHLNAADRSKLPKVEEELLFFSVFALDYWIQTGTARTQEERCILRQALHAHLAKTLVVVTRGKPNWILTKKDSLLTVK